MSGELLITLFMLLGSLGLPGEHASRFMHTDMCMERLDAARLNPGAFESLELTVDFAINCLEDYGTRDDMSALSAQLSEDLEQGGPS